VAYCPQMCLTLAFLLDSVPPRSYSYPTSDIKSHDRVATTLLRSRRALLQSLFDIVPLGIVTL